MNRVRKSIAATILMLALLCSAALAEGNRKDFFSFINAHTTPTAQPDLSKEEQFSLTLQPNETITTQYATYTVTDAAFDGNALYLLVEAVPAENVLLISGYGYEPEDLIFYEDMDNSANTQIDSESFAQRAVREQKQLVSTALFSCTVPEEMAYEGESYSEAYYADGVLQLYARISLPDYAPEYADTLRICENAFGAESSETEFTLRIPQTAHSEKALWQGEMQVGPIRLTEAEINRSEIFASLKIRAHVAQNLSKADAELLEALEFLPEAIHDFTSGIFLLNEQGELQWESPSGGETILLVSCIAAGERMPESLTCTIRNYSKNVTLGKCTLPLTVVP